MTAALVTSSGTILSGITVLPGVNIDVTSGGFAQDLTIAGGSLSIETGASASNTVVSAGAVVLRGGTARNTTLDQGVEYVLSGSDVNCVVSSGGIQDLFGGSVSSATIMSGGQQFVYSGTCTGDTVLAGGYVCVTGGGSVTDTSLAGGEIDLEGGSLDLSESEDGPSPAGTVLFGYLISASLQIDCIANSSLVISGFAAPADTISFTSIGSLPAPEYLQLDNNDVLQVIGSSGEENITFDATSCATSYMAYNDAYGDICVVPVTQQPTITTIDLADGSELAATPELNILSPVDEVDGVGLPGADIALLANGVQIGEATVNDDASWSFQILQPLETYTVLTAVQINGDLLPSAQSQSISVQEQLEAPTNLIVENASQDASSGYYITNQPQPTVIGTGTAGATVQLFLGSSLIGSTLCDDGGEWSITLTTALPNGSYTLQAQQTELGYASSLDSGTLTVTVNSSPVDMPVLMPTGGLGIVGSSQPQTTVRLMNGLTVLATVSPDASGDFSFSPSTLPPGSYSISAVSINDAGTTSAASTPIQVTVVPGGSYIASVIGSASTNTWMLSANNTLLSTTNAAQGYVTLTDFEDNTAIQPTLGVNDLTLTGMHDEAVAASTVSIIDDRGAYSSITGGSGSETVFGEGGYLSFKGGTGAVLFVAGAGAGDSIQGGSGGLVVFSGSQGCTARSGGAYFLFISEGGDDRILAAVGTAPPIAFGSPGCDTTISSAASDYFFVAGPGSETVSAASSSAGGLFFAGSGACNMTGGTSGNFFQASSGSCTISGGHSNLYAVAREATPHTIEIKDFNLTDILCLTGFGTTAQSGISAETETGGALMLHLTDGSSIIMDGIASAASIVGCIIHH